MKLFPGCATEYNKRHSEIWPDVASLLKRAGVRDYYIFLDEETNILFASFKIIDEQVLETLPALQVMKDWWASLVDIMETNPDNSPITRNLKEMFYLQ